MYDAEAKNIKYTLLFEEHHMFEAEGIKEGLPTRRPNAISDADAVIYGLVAQIQDLRYNEEQAEDEASVARNSKAKFKATKKIITPKKIVFYSH